MQSKPPVAESLASRAGVGRASRSLFPGPSARGEPLNFSPLELSETYAWVSSALVHRAEGRDRLGRQRRAVLVTDRRGRGLCGTGLGLRGPLDPVLDHAALERVTGDSKQLSGLHDAAGTIERLRAEESFGFPKVQVFEEDRHGTQDK